jgi:hypothetical protein
MMKARQTLRAIMLIALTLVAGATQTSRGNNQDLLNIPIENLELKAANIGLLLSDLSTQKNVPIGLEVSPQDDLSKTKTVRLQIKRGTLADVLTSIVKQNPLYTWKIQDGVINVLPVEANRDPLLRDVLETRLEKFSIERGMSKFYLRQILSTTPAIKTILTQHKVVADNSAFMSREFTPLGRGYELEASNITVSGLLNQIVRESQTKYWVVQRYGDKRQYFILTL